MLTAMFAGDEVFGVIADLTQPQYPLLSNGQGSFHFSSTRVFVLGQWM